VSPHLLPLDSPEATLARVGGKGRNLAELLRAGFPVPPGFLVTTDAHRAAVAAGALPGSLADEVRAALRRLGAAAVAVRSSATAEDLAEASFAGQQDTYLDVRGAEAVLAAIEGCWASLWSERAIAYREHGDVAGDGLAMGVVVQAMVPADTAGVAFTANPLTGRRDEVVVDAVRGLGEPLVSGAVEPDSFLVDPTTWTVKERRPVGSPVLADDAVVEVARMAQRVAARAGAPQDVEWAYAGGELAILQARPITSLYPPLPTPRSAAGLRVYLNTLVAQGVDFPMTPLGLDLHFVLQHDYLAILSVRRPADEVVLDAGGRQFVDVTDLVADPQLRRLLLGAIGTRDQGSRQAVLSLIQRGRVPERHVFTLRRKLRFARTARRPLLRIAGGLAAPLTMRRGALQTAELQLAAAERRAAELDTLAERVDGVADTVRGVVGTYWVGVGSLCFSAYACHWLLNRWLPRWAGLDRTVVLELLRGLPANVTTQMNLALWELAQAIRADAAAGEALRREPPAALVAAYARGAAPPTLQQGLARFLGTWGIRGDDEIDIGRPRWRDDPTPILRALVGYLELDDPALAPDESHRRGAAEAEQRAAEIVSLVGARRGRLRAVLVRATIRRLRELYGTREFPKHANMRVLAAYRPILVAAGHDLAAAGELGEAEDIFFVPLGQLRRRAAGEAVDLRSIVAAERTAYERELRRRQVPRILLSNGEAFHGGMAHDGAEGLVGDPVSPGVAEGRARIVLDPRTTRLAPGEILVCPRTDPGWTPLFLTAGAVVMEVGGMTTHGSVVAREHGIPAVVSVHEATTRLKDGDLVRVDGTTGRVTVLEAAA
jgi:pyruvate,water dikinase